MTNRYLIDTLCVLSIAGIWPRFIEPKLLKTEQIKIPLCGQGKITIAHLTDLHLNPSMGKRFTEKIVKKVKALKPDIIVFTGDFLCKSKLGDKGRLQEFLGAFDAPFGCFASLGNHDYQDWITVNDEGEYDIDLGSSDLSKGISRLLFPKELKGKRTKKAEKVKLHEELIEIFQNSPFTLLHNQTVKVPIRDTVLNITGLGDYTTGHFQPQKAFLDFDNQYPGIVLSHNPDSFPLLKNYPGNLILSGHTHGGELNIPFLWKRLTPMENPKFKRGLVKEKGKWLYVNRGVGSSANVRLLCPPEIAYITLEE
jgi:hypothetical protein